ncbi:MAG: ribosomal protein S18-alanine N-acetyltransferase [Acidobacteria bacterium]|nr:ribosomal protein S18-alanine N-acetyltransferase [Acidobacteriota bacterium]
MLMVSTLESSHSYLRSMQESDLPQVAEIERETFPSPWPLSSFRQCLDFGYCCRVLAQGSLVQAYAIMAVEVDAAHILNLCVRSEFRQQGEGRQMLNHLLKLARAAQVKDIFLEVRVSNHPAVHLYQSADFVKIGTRKDYYPSEKGREDALILVKRLSAEKLEFRD